MNPLSKYWNDLSERKQTGLRLAGVALVLVLTVTVLISVVSYLFTWRQDQSLLSAAAQDQAQNLAASSGFSLGHFLVTNSFGLAAFCIVAFLLAWSIKLVKPTAAFSLKKMFYGMLSLSFLLSWILAFVGILAGWEWLFAGGPGGRAGAAIVGWMLSKVGEIVTGLVLLVLSATWLYCMSGRFAAILMGKREEKPEEAPQEEPVQEPAVVEPVFVTSPTEEPKEEEPKKPRRLFTRKPKEEPVPEAEEENEEETAEEDGGITVVTDDTLDQEVKEPLKPIDNRLDPPDGLPKYKTPELSILGDYLNARHEVSQDELSRNNNKIRATLASYKI